jgi:hypothetical protein
MIGKEERFVSDFVIGEDATFRTAHHLEWKHLRRRIDVKGFVALLVANVPPRAWVFATVEVLAQFCQRFPERIARFLTPWEQGSFVSVGRVVMMVSATATSCKETRGVTE